MKLLTFDTDKTARLFWGLLALVGVIVMLTARQSDPGVYAAGALLLIVSLFPFYVWLLGWSHGLPIWPVFCLANGLGYAMAMIQNPDTLAEFTPAEVTIGGITTAAFVCLGTMAWVSLTSRAPKPPKNVVMVEERKSVNYLMMFIAMGVAFQLNKMGKWISFPGNSEMVVRGVALSLASMGLFVLSFYAGRGLLRKGVQWYLAVTGTFLILFGLSTLMLAQASIPLAMIVLGYTFGAGRVPWKIVAAAFLVVAILHPGKYPMREKYWGGGGQALTLISMPAFFGEWAGYGLEEIGGFSGVLRVEKKTEDSASSAFERAGNLHMLLKVIKLTPQEVPFFNGLTYEHIPRMLVPRFIDDQKGISHAGNQILSVNYGLVEAENVNTVSIGWGLIPEAYANFGYLGVGVLAFILAGFYSLITRLTVGVPLTSLRFVIGLLVMVAATTPDTMGIFVSSQFQGIVAVTMGSLVFMRRQPNPFALGEHAPIPQLEGSVETSHHTEPAPGHLRNPVRGQRSDRGAALNPQGTARPPMRLEKWGGQRPPKWAPLAHRKAFELAAARRAAEMASRESKEVSDNGEKAARPRQVAVPIQPYYYRSRKA